VKDASITCSGYFWLSEYNFVVYGELAIDNRVHVQARLREDRRIYINSTGLGLFGLFRRDHFQLDRGGDEAHRKLEPTKIAKDFKSF